MKKKRNKKVIAMPCTPVQWMADVAYAYRDARDAIPFGSLTGQTITESELFHMAPQVCLKFRQIEQSPTNLRQATDAMLTSYVATREHDEQIFINPHIAFAFAYLASHFGMGLLSEAEVAEIMECIESHAVVLADAIERIRANQAL